MSPPTSICILYYDVRHPLRHKRPDWFAVLGTSKLYEGRDLRLSYVVWQEGVNPFIVVELLSPGTEQEDLGRAERDIDQPPGKWEVYEQILRIPYYVVFSRYANRLQVFGLAGSRYQERPLMEGKIWLSEPGLGLGVWSGAYQGLRYQSGTPSGRTPGGSAAKAEYRTGRLNSVFLRPFPRSLSPTSERGFFGLLERVPASLNPTAHL